MGRQDWCNYTNDKYVQSFLSFLLLLLSLFTYLLLVFGRSYKTTAAFAVIAQNTKVNRKGRWPVRRLSCVCAVSLLLSERCRILCRPACSIRSHSAARPIPGAVLNSCSRFAAYKYWGSIKSLRQPSAMVSAFKLLQLYDERPMASILNGAMGPIVIAHPAFKSNFAFFN